MVSRGARGGRGEAGRVGFLGADRGGTRLVAVQGHGGHGSGDGSWWGQEAIRIEDTGLAGLQGQVGVDVVFSVGDGQAQGLGQVDGIVEDGRGAEGDGEVPYTVGHCAGARMHVY